MKPRMQSDPERKEYVPTLINHVLAIGRRVIFLFIGGLAVIAAAFWIVAPDVNHYRPDIEKFLRQELSLQQLSLGELSWYWAGHLGVRARNCSFSTADKKLSVHNSDVTVNVDLLDFLFGKIRPSGIHLKSGAISIVADSGSAAGMPLPDLVTLQEMQLTWQFKGLSGHLDHLTLSLERQDGDLHIRVPGSHLEVTFDENQLPEMVNLEFSNLEWLPEQWRQTFEGAMSGSLRVQKKDPDSWKVRLKLDTTKTVPAAFSFLGQGWQFDRVTGSADVTLDSGAVQMKSLSGSVNWEVGSSSISASLHWQDGALEIDAASPQLSMPLVWHGLGPLGGDGWHAWLETMKQGSASGVRAHIMLPWASPLDGGPRPDEIGTLKYRVSGHVENVDVSLGIHDDSITETSGDVEIDESGLKAVITGTRLPHQVGTASGNLHIPWKNMMIEVAGRGKIDAGRLHRWMEEDEANELNWGESQSQASFSIQWKPDENLPRRAQISLTPLKPWKLAPKGVDLLVNSGELGWEFGKGISFSNVDWQTPHLHIKSDIKAERDSKDQWQMVSMKSSAMGSLGDLTAFFLLPIEKASGRIAMSLDYDQGWHGNIDLKNASWGNFLGTEKAAGEALVIDFEGANGERLGKRMIQFNQIRCKERLIRFNGRGEVSADGLRLNLENIDTASFSSSMAIQAPFGPDPWELDVNAQYLNRNALPLFIVRNAKLGKKPWALRAHLKRFVWDDAEMEDVEIKLASALNSVGVLKAGRMRSGELRMRNLMTIFSMPGGGAVDLRTVEAQMDGLKLNLSAILTPDAERGMRWRGFARLSGDFGNMMKRADLSNIFEHGDMDALFSGQGEILNDQPWWKSLDGRLRMRVKNGRIMKGGTLSKFFAAISIVDLPGILLGDRDDLTKPGLGYKRLQMEALIHSKNVQLYNLALRSSAMDVAGKGVMDIDSTQVDLTLVMRPFQNMDALLSKLPIIRDIFGGEAHSFIRRVYRMHGPIANAEVERISPEEAGLAAPGMIEKLLNLPSKWFGDEESSASEAGGQLVR